MADLVTIIVPIYNSEKTIGKTIESIINQTYNNLEILLIDDCSQDDSVKVCKKYADIDKRIQIIKKEKNSGVSNTRNIGISEAKGEYISFVDADDIVENDFIELSVNISKNTGSDIVIEGFNRVYEDKKIKVSFEEDKEIKKEEIIEYEKAILNNENLDFPVEILGFSWGKLYKSNIIKKIKFNEKIRFREDSLFNLEAYSLSSKIFLTKKIGYDYIINNDSASFRFFENYEDEIKEFFNSIKKIKNKDILEEDIKICGLYMYMNFLKHYAMHKKIKEKKLSSYSLIKESTNSKLWNDYFKNVNTGRLSLPYKILRFFYLKKFVLGIMLLYKLNSLKGEKI